MTTINLSQKERMLLEDQKSHEEICIQKYTNYASQAQDPELKNLLNTYAQEEKQHYNTINQILSGQVPNMNQQQGQQQQNQQNQMSSQTTRGAGMDNSNDASICNDLLMTEKYVSGTYDTAIFECSDTNLRDTLNHIQKEEQKHGEGIFKYMESKGMYNVK
ncbi:spore coat protein [Tissierella sp. Yu-01]|uniref:spore coat protein n=1 Tax=Tissierella sp. Yu-01 TaxID=3035694 RepID=UPI00240CEC6A|nr:spore coat protein [Tissierella sp. Yu-01]WFA07796.1 spore coat protein [Tissierella sp. Yu-01]